MALKEISIALGIAAGSAGIANSGYGLYDSFVVRPGRNAEYNESLLTAVPLVVETVEIQPDPQMAMRVEVTVKIFKTGDILVESGARRQFISFGLGRERLARAGPFLRSALAAETAVIDGVRYDVETVRYTEVQSKLSRERIRRVRTFADGTVETADIDIRSNAVVEVRTEKRELTPEEQRTIAASPYRKKIFKAR